MNNPVLYLWFHKTIFDKYGCCKIEKKVIYETMMERYKVPKCLAVAILREMIILQMFEECNRDNVIIKQCIMNPQENINVIYLKLGIF